MFRGRLRHFPLIQKRKEYYFIIKMREILKCKIFLKVKMNYLKKLRVKDFENTP